MSKILSSEAEMIDFGAEIVKILKQKNYRVLELIGDVGAGKTTFTRGLAKALGISEEVTSPSFTISKQYKTAAGRLIHYDFYRLNDPGIMIDELAENLADENAIIVIEWGESVANLLPENRLQIEILVNDDGSRSVEIKEFEK